MARPRNTQPTDGELELLRILWQHGPCELRVVCEAIRSHRDVATTTVATVLRVMLGKGLVKRHRGPRGYLWSAKVTQETATTGMLRKLVDHVFDGSAQRLVTHLLEAGDLNDDERDEIRRLLETYDSERSAHKNRK